jgi:hypothetical protein
MKTRSWQRKVKISFMLLILYGNTSQLEVLGVFILQIVFNEVNQMEKVEKKFSMRNRNSLNSETETDGANRK